MIVVVLESMTAQAFDPAHDSLSDMPNVRRLRQQSFLLGRHYTSYPVTADAAFSIFTSLYSTRPRNVMNTVVEVPSLVRSLRNDGYQTGFYGFVWKRLAHDDSMLIQSLGFEKIVAPYNDFTDQQVCFGPPELIEGVDRRALHSLREDIHDWTARRQKFAAAFFPEVGHDPYRELNGHTFKTPLERGHALAVYQDAWLGEILDELQKDGALQNTIIVLTADHGMRFMRGHEYSRVDILSHGKLEDVMLRVPMMIYVPGVLQHPVAIDAPTSHIDITPTLQDLLGITSGREFEQGSSVFSPDIIKRRLFLQMDMFGSSGYYYEGNYYSRDSLGMTYEGPTLEFRNSDIVKFESKEAEEIGATLAAEDSNQDAFLSAVLHED